MTLTDLNEYCSQIRKKHPFSYHYKFFVYPSLYGVDDISWVRYKDEFFAETKIGILNFRLN